MHIRATLFILILSYTFTSCRSGAQLTEGETRIEFAERQWQVKTGNFRRGPGNNFFGGSKKNLFVDLRGHLHLKITERDGSLYCVELNTRDTLGYGRYTYEIEADFHDFDPKVVLGLFTWDHSSFDTQANSEIDIEFSKWGFPLAESLMHYSIHPVALERLHLERSYSSKLSAKELSGIRTHVMEWRDTSVSFYSYLGKNTLQENLMDRFHYSFKNPARIKSADGKRSDPIKVPKPGVGVQAHINLWILGLEKTLENEKPEIVIRDFKYEAY